MSTNYYVKIVPTSNDFKILKEKLLNSPIKDSLTFIENFDEEIHLGKQSATWKFLFQYNNGRFYRTIPELKSFINSMNIYDEYDGIVTQEEFWNSVLSRQKDKSHLSSDVFKIEEFEFVDYEFF